MSQDDGGPGASFEDRLKVARSKQGLDAPLKRPLSDQDQLGGSAWGIGAREIGRASCRERVCMLV